MSKKELKDLIGVEKYKMAIDLREELIFKIQDIMENKKRGLVVDSNPGMGAVKSVLNNAESYNEEYFYYHTYGFDNSKAFYEFLKEHNRNDMFILLKSNKDDAFGDMEYSLLNAILNENDNKEICIKSPEDKESFIFKGRIIVVDSTNNNISEKIQNKDAVVDMKILA